MSSEQTNAIIHIPRPFPHVRFAFGNTAVVYIFYQLSMILLVYLLGGIGSSGKVWMQGLGHLLFMLVPALLLMKYSSLGRRALLRFEGNVGTKQWVLGLAGIAPLILFGAGWMIMQEALLPDSWLPVYHKLQNTVDEMYESLLIGDSIVAVFGAYVVGAVIPALAEEFLFRGLMQRSLEEVWSPLPAVVVTGIIFGLVHFNPVALVPLVALGIYFGLLAWYTRSLALPIVVHFFNNAISITSLNIMAREPHSALTSQAPWWQGALMAIAGLAMLAFILMRLFSTRRLLRTEQWMHKPV